MFEHACGGAAALQALPVVRAFGCLDISGSHGEADAYDYRNAEIVANACSTVDYAHPVGLQDALHGGC